MAHGALIRSQILQHGFRNVEDAFTAFVSLAENLEPARLRPVAVKTGLNLFAVEHEAGQQQRQLAHIRLAVTGVDAERVQLHHLAAEVLVHAAAPLLRLPRVRPHGLRLIQKHQHRRVQRHRLQQVRKAAGQIGTDRLCLIERHDQPHLRRLAGADGKMIEPEAGQPLLKAEGRACGLGDPARNIGVEPRRRVPVQRLFPLSQCLAVFHALRQILAHQPVLPDAPFARLNPFAGKQKLCVPSLAQLFQQRVRIALRCLARCQAKSEAHPGNHRP